jgi:hypothetical protein
MQQRHGTASRDSVTGQRHKAALQDSVTEVLQRDLAIAIHIKPLQQAVHLVVVRPIGLEQRL